MCDAIFEMSRGLRVPRAEEFAGLMLRGDGLIVTAIGMFGEGV
ncbi:hypothetical protein GGD81_003890 [Rhodobium orientis]|nr:hypothetical protein [Rhodobium orientis]MBB4304826.1 hypothetical protein [Rhodobium orientis]